MKPKEQAAFVSAYLNNVAYAPEEYVTDFVKRYSEGEDLPYCEYYTSIVDALGMWRNAISYQQSQEVTA